MSCVWLALAATGATAVDGDWTRRPEAVAVGTVYHYVKSNLDGSRPGRIAVYVADEERVESFKWSPGQPMGSLVVAGMDWTTFSVATFRAHRVSAARRVLSASLDTTADGSVEVKLGDAPTATIPITRWPWHSYDFDFAGLSFFWPHRTNPEAEVTVGIADFVRRDGSMTFAEKGPVTIRYVGDEERDGLPCRRYRADGPGLEDRGADLWTALDGGHLVELASELPDEPGYSSNRLRLERVETLPNEDDWLAFLAASLSAG